MTEVHASSRPHSVLGLITHSLVSPRSASRTVQIAKIWAPPRALWFSKIVSPSLTSL